MKTLTLSSDEFVSTLDDLKYYFGFHKLEHFQAETFSDEKAPLIRCCAENEPVINVSFWDNRVSVCIHQYWVELKVPDEPFDIMEKHKELLSESPFEKRIQTLLFTLRWLTRKLDQEGYMKAPLSYREDMLKLYLLCQQNKNLQGWVGIKSAGGSIRLKNEGNRFFEHLKEIIFYGVENEEQAQAELDSMKRKRGRQPKDERSLAVLWGTFQYLTSLQGFRSDMPNALCDFLICLLQWMEYIPSDSPIDRYWIRAELRYMRSRAVKPFFLP